jgi:predicted Zn-dependent peptidase
MSSLTDDFPEVLRVFAEVLRRPAFATDRVDVAKTAVRATISRRNDEPMGIVFREIQRVVYGADSPYARNAEYSTLAAITREDLVQWHETYYHPERVILGLVGDFDSDEALAAIREAFGDWPRGGETETPEVWFDEEPNPGIYVADKTDVTQSNIAMGHLGIRRDHPDYYALRVLNQIFSGGGSSRLYSEVRTRRGLAYGVFGQVGADWDHPGLTLVWTSTKVESTGEALGVLLDESRALRSERPPTAQEVEEAKNAILSSFVFEVDSAEEVLREQLTLEAFGYPLDRLAKFRERIDAVSVDDVQRVAREQLHPDRFAIVVVGPSGQFLSDLEPFGEVTELDITIPPPPRERAEATAESAGLAVELLSRAVEAAGGAERLANLEAIRQESTARMNGPMGQMELAVTGLRVYPDKVRQEVQTPMGRILMVTTPDRAFMVTPQGAVPMPPSRAEETRKDLWRNPVSLLKAFVERESRSDFSAVAAGTEQVELEVAGVVGTLTLDPESGRVLELTYQGSGPDGAPGQVRETYSDFREVDGLVYPFSVVSTFEGEPVSTVTVQSLELDPEVPADAFEQPGE